ncbi:YceI family protein [Sphingobacterium sp. LRF_L2]|uniref:YceI family protein n=1 Tax=Sphingobacterium sp. LRF_L2 TaxID=3369421 RepID=UPI003F630FE3
MNTKNVYALLAAGMIFAACGGNGSNTATSTEQEVASQQGDVFAVDLAASNVSWKAFHKGGFAPRWGTLSLSSGEISVDNGEITSGDFVIDMNSLHVDSASVTEEGKKASDLENHLKNADFFNVETNPTAEFHITGVSALSGAVEGAVEGANKTVSGNLTLMGTTLNISFPAKIEVSGEGVVSVNAKFTVNRADWGIKFGTTETDPAEWMISKDIEIGINLTAKK